MADYAHDTRDDAEECRHVWRMLGMDDHCVYCGAVRSHPPYPWWEHTPGPGGGAA